MLSEDKFNSVAEAVATVAVGMTAAEWQKVNRAIERLFSSKSAKVCLEDFEEIKQKIIFGLKFD